MVIALTNTYRRYLKRVLGLSCPKDVINTIARHHHFAYNSNTRWYHDLTHIQEGLEFLEKLDIDVYYEHVPLGFAWFYHDSYYIPQLAENEQYSAEILWIHSAALELNDDTTVEACSLVRMTDGKKTPQTKREKWMVDTDYSIFAASQKRVEEYDFQIRSEFKNWPDPQFNRGRGEFLKKLIDRGFMFYSDEYKSAYEDRAQENLKTLYGKYEEYVKESEGRGE